MISKATANIALISTGVVGTLLFLLYLPMLISSPPWSEDGYYVQRIKSVINIEGYCICHVREGAYALYAKTAEGLFKLDENASSYLASMKFKIINESLTVKTPSLGFLAEPVTLYKTANPFTLWYIKWLEWTN